MRSKAAVAATVFVVAGVASIATFAANQKQSTNFMVSQSHDEWELEKEFLRYIAKFRKNYFNREEYQARFDLWKLRKTFVEESNANPEHTFTLAMNHFADVFDHEFKLNINGFDASSSNHGSNGYTTLRTDSLPDSVNWVTEGKVSAVKNQGSCGSCWAFSATQAVESCAAIEQGKTPEDLSEQQLVDCATAEGNKGCQGGLMDGAFEYIIKAGGIDTNAQYPYEGRNGNCNPNNKFAAKITGYTDVPAESEEQLKAAVAKQPVAVAVDAAGLAFQLYFGGVVNNKWLCGTSLDHGVLLVGYGYDAKKKLNYWLVKNSWGASWGEKGYIRIARNGDGKGMCGIQQQNSYPSGCSYN